MIIMINFKIKNSKIILMIIIINIKTIVLKNLIENIIICKDKIINNKFNKNNNNIKNKNKIEIIYIKMNIKMKIDKIINKSI